MLIKKNIHSGFTIVEVVVAVTIILTSLVGLAWGYQAYVRASFSATRSFQATLLAEEGIEAVQSIRDFGWSSNIGNVATNTPLYLSWNGVRWTLGTSSVPYIDNIFDRVLTLDSVMRDANDSIALIGTVDSGTRKVTASVSWLGKEGTTTYSVSTYLADLYAD